MCPYGEGLRTLRGNQRGIYKQPIGSSAGLPGVMTLLQLQVSASRHVLQGWCGSLQFGPGASELPQRPSLAEIRRRLVQAAALQSGQACVT